MKQASSTAIRWCEALWHGCSVKSEAMFNADSCMVLKPLLCAFVLAAAVVGCGRKAAVEVIDTVCDSIPCAPTSAEEPTPCYATDTAGRSAFVYVTDVVPDVLLDIRYYSTYNFVGTRIDGYRRPVALLTKRAADSLRAASDDLLQLGYRIKIYDAYRPQCAVDHFVRWGRNLADTAMRQCFYPHVEKHNLFAQDYISSKSGHSRGSTVDITLFDVRTGKDVDMGGTFDWFGTESSPTYGTDPTTGNYVDSPGITAQQFANRMLLRTVMMRHGFRPLYTEWWHFTLRNEPFADTYFNFAVE